MLVSLGGRNNVSITKVVRASWEQTVAFFKRDPPITEDKADAGWYALAEFSPRYRDSENFVARHGLTFDYDHVSLEQMETVFAAIKLEGYAAFAYTTASHTAEKPRWRVLFPLSRPITYDEFQALSRFTADALGGIELPARESHTPAQYMFLPTVKPGSKWLYREFPGVPIDVDTTLPAHWSNRATWPHRKDGDGVHTKESLVSPLDKPGIVGDFCRAFSISAAIERFDLPYRGGSEDGRLTYTKGSRPDGAVVYDNDTKLHSHHDTDPARGQNNSFDLVRLHRFGSLDDDAARDLPVTQRPSFKAMAAFAREQAECRAEAATAEFSDLGDLPVASDKGDRANASGAGPAPTEEGGGANTGLPSTELPSAGGGLPDPTGPVGQAGDIPEVRYSAAAPLESGLENALKVVEEIAAKARLVVYGNQLMKIFEDKREGFNKIKVPTLEMKRVGRDDLPSMLVGHCKFMVKRKLKDDSVVWARVDIPPILANAIVVQAPRLTRASVKRITSTPILADGQLVAAPGFNEEHEAWILAPEGVVLGEATEEAARAALERLDDWLSEFPFAGPEDRSVALAALLTAAMRASLPHAPGFLVSKPDYGSGASTLCDLINVILNGRPAAVINAASKGEELDKVIDGMLLAGLPAVVIDNVPDGTVFNSVALAQVISQPTRQLRPLGRSNMMNVPCTQLVLVNGNNIAIGDDLIRRFVKITIDPNLENPHQRTFKRPFLIREAQMQRAQLLSDCYTIVNAYRAVGGIATNAIAGFEEWARTISAALVWLGKPDPIASQKTIERQDSKRSQWEEIMTAWLATVGDKPVSLRHLLEEDFPEQAAAAAKAELHRLVSELCAANRNTSLTLSFGNKLRAVKDKIMGGMKIESVKDSHNKQQLWRVHRVEKSWLD